MNLIVARFQSKRWGKTRRRLDSMKCGSTFSFPLTEKFNVMTSIARIKHAYGDRDYKRHDRRDRTLPRDKIIITRTL